MEKVLVNLNQIENVKAFTKRCSEIPLTLKLVSGPYTVDAKSILGAFSLDLSKPIEFVIETDDDTVRADVLSKIKEFLA